MRQYLGKFRRRHVEPLLPKCVEFIVYIVVLVVTREYTYVHRYGIALTFDDDILDYGWKETIISLLSEPVHETIFWNKERNGVAGSVSNIDSTNGVDRDVVPLISVEIHENGVVDSYLFCHSSAFYIDNELENMYLFTDIHCLQDRIYRLCDKYFDNLIKEYSFIKDMFYHIIFVTPITIFFNFKNYIHC